jgi:hypothetical protein
LGLIFNPESLFKSGKLVESGGVTFIK